MTLGAAAAIALAVAVALQWLPARPEPAPRSARADATQITLSIGGDGPALHIAHGGFAVTFEF